MPQTPPCVACGEPLEGWEGHSCYKCVQGLAEQRDDLFDEVMKLRYENKILKEGLPIEEAKECGDYYCLDPGYCVATYFENGKWYYSDDGPNRNPCEVSNRLYPLPSTDTKEDN